MAYKLPPLSWLRSFEASARHCSFTAAAEELNLTQAAVSNQVRSLEKHLGYPLFERLSRSLKLTDMGRAYLPPVRKAFEDLSMTTTGLFGSQAHSTVTVRAPISFAVSWLSPRIKDFRADHPHIDVRLCSAIWAENLAADRTDIDIRFGDGKWAGFDAHLLKNDDAILVYNPIIAAAPAAGELIHVMGLEDMWSRYFKLVGEARKEIPNHINVDTSLAALEMAASAPAAAIVLRSFAEPYLKTGRLLTKEDVAIPVKQSHYILQPEQEPQHKPEAVLFRNWLLKEADQI
ncbi:LysR family transcriptional regulator [Aestuariispira insulae]|uniref:LysR family transcriptional regulator n=1 Tax=Aestuariispira insulae TaxID=1461337 RepID=A0A3D9HMK6_9PROT|nr:LysR family transcriptional regulator [Aestuariispira insulae]RED50737.1 LysR family transcriptional regulator [Aestuariispira insulae]